MSKDTTRLEEQIEWFKKDRTDRAVQHDFLVRRVMELEAERDRYRDALEAIADDVEEWEMKLVAMQALKEIDNV